MKYFGLLLLALTAENFFFSRVFGLGSFLEKGFHKKNLLSFCMITVLSVTACVAAVKPLAAIFPSESAMTFVLVLLSSAVVLGLGVLARAFRPDLFEQAEAYFPSLIVNTVACALAILKDTSLGFGAAVVYAVGAGLGILLAGWLMSLVLDRVRFADVPEAFKGLPIALICASLLSLLFTAFGGLELLF